MKHTALKLSRLVPGPPDDVFDVWLDPKSPGGPWHGAKKVLLSAVVDGMFYFALERAGGDLAHFGRFTRVDRGRAVEHTWMSRHTQGLETTVSLTFEAVSGGTQLTIIHRGLPNDEAVRGHENGWNSLLARISEHFRGKA